MGKKKSSERYIGLVGADEGRKRDFGDQIAATARCQGKKPPKQLGLAC
jgi:hypothetical protein